MYDAHPKMLAPVEIWFLTNASSSPPALVTVKQNMDGQRPVVEEVVPVEAVVVVLSVSVVVKEVSVPVIDEDIVTEVLDVEDIVVEDIVVEDIVVVRL